MSVSQWANNFLLPMSQPGKCLYIFIFPDHRLVLFLILHIPGVYDNSGVCAGASCWWEYEQATSGKNGRFKRFGRCNLQLKHVNYVNYRNNNRNRGHYRHPGNYRNSMKGITDWYHTVLFGPYNILYLKWFAAAQHWTCWSYILFWHVKENNYMLRQFRSCNSSKIPRIWRFLQD